MSATASPSNRNGDAARQAPDQDVSFLILRAFYNLRGMLDRMLVEHDVDEWVQPGMGPILYALYQQDGCTIRDIGERVLLAPSTLTNTLKRMENKGLVRLDKDAADRRAVRVSLTARGRKLEADMNDMRTQVRRVLQGDMSPRQLQQAKSILSQMIESMDVHEWESKHPSHKNGRR